ncbi:type 1 glutamine amidotransferase [Altericista sp. CCNU0014]|uniref:type 1 glutamine amidotransferase n=1 Tax=Altericista sp. CCNU0014 TaxID=3082949 RepID=UPI00384F3BE5
MGLKRSQLRILYLQIREDGATRAEELQEFIAYSGLEEHQFLTLNVFDTPNFYAEKASECDAVFVGGSSDASVLDPLRYPFVEDAKVLLAYCVRESIPVFASCFGFQLAVEALGGKVIADPDRMEMGVYPMQLLPAARDDLLLHDVSNGFLAISGHKERALTLPDRTVCLASTERCPYHALKAIGKPFYAFQFHPELNPQDLAARIQRYQSRYFDDDNRLQQILASLQETPDANRLIAKFVDRILLSY